MTRQLFAMWAMLAVVAGGPPSALAQLSSEPFAGMSLVDALRALQARGLRIVFTSAAVTPDLRVQAEPRARAARQILEELLAPHGLEAENGPGGVIQIVRAKLASSESHRPPSDATGRIEGRVVHAFTRAPLEGAIVQADGLPFDVRSDAAGRFALRQLHPGTWTLHASMNGFALFTRVVRVIRGATVNVTVILSPTVTTHSEHVTVTSSRPSWQDRGIASDTSFDRSVFAQSHGGLADDPVRTVHALPRVSAADDFRSEFTVRGSPFRHVGVVVDGVATPWLQHTAYGRGATGSLTMLTSHVLEDATLRVGAYPRRYGDRLGPELDLTLREGSRERFELRGAAGGTSATVVGEGPLGRSGERARGSWLIAARQSYLEWPAVRSSSPRTAFGFADGLGKLVYDVRPNHRVGVSVLGGISNVDGEDVLGPSELGDGTNRTTVANVFWRSTLDSTTVVTQRAYVVNHGFVNGRTSGQDGDRGTHEAFVYRADIARPLFGGLLESGGQLTKTSAWQRSAYVHFAWTVAPTFTLSPGIRVTASPLLPRPTVTRWILGQYGFRPRWTLNVSAGVSHQLPELNQVQDHLSDQPRLRPERATHLDVAIEQRLGKSVRWQATIFTRDEADVLREPDVYSRLAGGVLIYPDDVAIYVNSLSAASRGVELLVNRQSATGLSGWAAYSYGRTRSVDADRREAFWADFDQRHTLNLFGTYRFSTRTSLGATFRAGSGFPIPAYLTERGGRLFVSSQRNQVRLPPYVRLDVRASRSVETFGRRLTLFCEVANVLNRANVGLAHGSIDTSTGEAAGFTETMLRRRASAGLLIEF